MTSKFRRPLPSPLSHATFESGSSFREFFYNSSSFMSATDASSEIYMRRERMRFSEGGPEVVPSDKIKLIYTSGASQATWKWYDLSPKPE